MKIKIEAALREIKPNEIKKTQSEKKLEVIIPFLKEIKFQKKKIPKVDFKFY